MQQHGEKKKVLHEWDEVRKRAHKSMMCIREETAAAAAVADSLAAFICISTNWNGTKWNTP